MAGWTGYFTGKGDAPSRLQRMVQQGTTSGSVPAPALASRPVALRFCRRALVAAGATRSTACAR
jgi:hypothetical protein